tara:strand:- start:1177 stop:3624 length:2448 start_codon:yes stop_codon:yes gene_type:complete
MARVRIPLPSFEFGELNQSLTSRVDTQVYTSAAEQIRNLYIRAEGSVVKRPGTKRLYNFSAPSYDASKRMQLRLEPFVFSDDEKYIFAFSDNKLDIFQINASTDAVSHIQAITTDVDSVTVPWDVTYLESFTYVQKGDVFFVTHPFFAIRKIVRTSLTTFQVEKFAFDESPAGDLTYMPFFSFQSPGVTITPTDTQSYTTTAAEAIDSSETTITLTSASDFPSSGRFLVGSEVITYTGKSTNDLTGCTRGAFNTTAAAHDNGSTATYCPKVTTSAAYFSTAYIGLRLRIGDSEVSIVGTSGTTQAAIVVLDVIRTTLDVDAIRTIDGTTTIQITHALHGLATGNSVTIDRAAAVGGINANQINGSRTITVLDENLYEVTAGASANLSTDGGGQPRIASTAATTEWAEQSYSALRGYPSATTFHENRLWFAGTLSQPDQIWASKSAEYFNFDIGAALDNDSLDLTSNVGDIFTIRHLVSNRDLQIFSTTAELYIPTSTTKPITPTSAVIRRQTPFGTGFARPIPLDGATLFTDRSGKSVREFLFTEGEDAYTGGSISALASHLVVTPTQQLVVSGATNRPETYAYFVNSDGTLAIFYTIRGEKKQGWSLWNTQGKFHSVCTIENRLFVASARDDGSGTTKYFLEEFDDEMPMDFCDTFSASSGVFGSLGSHFANNAVVKVVNGTDYLGEFTVGSAQIDVSAAKDSVSTGFLGYSFTPLLKTLPIDSYGTRLGVQMTGMPRKLTSVVLDLVDTMSISVNSNDLITRNVTDDMSQNREPVTGKREFRLLGYSRDPRVEISQSAPLDMQLNGMVVEVSR